MSREFRLPSLGSGLKEAQILAWKISVGDQVTSDQVLCEVETEKSVIEIPVPFAGVVERLGGATGAQIRVGDVLAVIAIAGAQVSQAAASNSSAGADSIPVEVRTAVSGPRLRAMPSVRRLARERGVALGDIGGSGPRGRILRRDVLELSGSKECAAASPNESPRRERLSLLRRTIAEHMTRSWREIPHVFCHLDLDATSLLEARQALGERLGRKFPLEGLLIRAVLPVLKDFPAFNATLDGDDLLLHRHFDIGVAVDTADGLVVPVLRDASAPDTLALGAKLADLLERAAQRKARPEELKGATFTVNNIGALGMTMGTSVIPYGTSAILSVGRAVPRPTVHNGQLIVRPTAQLGLAFDHRIIDGGLAVRFLDRVKQNLEQPARLLS